MKFSPRPTTLVLARLGQALRHLQALLMRWAPQLSPVLVPISIPIRTERRTRDAVERRCHRGV